MIETNARRQKMSPPLADETPPQADDDPVPTESQLMSTLVKRVLQWKALKDAFRIGRRRGWADRYRRQRMRRP